MDYKEALKMKNQIGDFIQEKDLKLKVYISPEIDEEFQRFLNDYPIRKFDDKSCLKYSTNNKFKLVGLWTDGASVAYKNL